MVDAGVVGTMTSAVELAGGGEEDADVDDGNTYVIDVPIAIPVIYEYFDLYSRLLIAYIQCHYIGTQADSILRSEHLDMKNSLFAYRS